MHFKIGCDILENKRINIEDLNLIKHILSLEEYKEYMVLSDKNIKHQFIASRWTVKEAIQKAISNKLIMSTITIKHTNEGKPFVLIPGWKIEISISHEKNYTMATCFCIK